MGVASAWAWAGIFDFLSHIQYAMTPTKVSQATDQTNKQFVEVSVE